MNIAEIIKMRREEILEIAKKYGAENVRIFGSVPRGEANSKSDLDLLIELKSGRTILDIIAIKQDVEDLIGLKVDVVTTNSISPYIKDEVLKKAVNL